MSRGMIASSAPSGVGKTKPGLQSCEKLFTFWIGGTLRMRSGGVTGVLVIFYLGLFT